MTLKTVQINGRQNLASSALASSSCAIFIKAVSSSFEMLERLLIVVVVLFLKRRIWPET